MPGWRLGWIAIHDPIGAFEPEIRHGLSCLSQKTIGSNSLVQGALSRILKETPQSFYDGLVETLHESAEVAFRAIEQINGLVPYMPEGTMYLMVKIELDSFPYFRTELEFIQKLMEEESVFCLPGQVRQTSTESLSTVKYLPLTVLLIGSYEKRMTPDFSKLCNSRQSPFSSYCCNLLFVRYVIFNFELLKDLVSILHPTIMFLRSLIYLKTVIFTLLSSTKNCLPPNCFQIHRFLNLFTNLKICTNNKFGMSQINCWSINKLLTFLTTKQCGYFFTNQFKTAKLELPKNRRF